MYIYMSFPWDLVELFWFGLWGLRIKTKVKLVAEISPKWGTLLFGLVG